MTEDDFYALLKDVGLVRCRNEDEWVATADLAIKINGKAGFITLAWKENDKESAQARFRLIEEKFGAGSVIETGIADIWMDRNETHPT